MRALGIDAGLDPGQAAHFAALDLTIARVLAEPEADGLAAVAHAAAP